MNAVSFLYGTAFMTVVIVLAGIFLVSGNITGMATAEFNYSCTPEVITIEVPATCEPQVCNEEYWKNHYMENEYLIDYSQQTYDLKEFFDACMPISEKEYSKSSPKYTCVDFSKDCRNAGRKAGYIVRTLDVTMEDGERHRIDAIIIPFEPQTNMIITRSDYERYGIGVNIHI